MNEYSLIILIALGLFFILDLLANFLNLKSLNHAIPDEFKELYSLEDYKKSQNYTRAQTHLGFVSSSFSLILILVFWFAGGFHYLDQVVRSWNQNSIVTGVLYISILVFGQSLLSLPFSIYSTFVLEERFGFNKTTPKTFLVDLVKGLFLSSVLGLPLLAGVLIFFESFGQWAWLWIWGLVTLYFLFIQFVAPVWIMPLFNKFTPLEEGELKEKITAFAQSIQFPLQGLYVIDGSRRSTKSNAFFTGFGKNKRIALYDTLIEANTISELVSVLAHEIGHYKKKHILQSMVLSNLQMGLTLYLLSIFLTHQGLFEAFYVKEPSVYTGLVFFGIFFSSFSPLLSILMNVFSRKNEFEADRFAVENTSDKEDLVSALKKLSVKNLTNLTPHPFYVFVNYSHPPLLQRVQAIRSAGQH